MNCTSLFHKDIPNKSAVRADGTMRRCSCGCLTVFCSGCGQPHTLTSPMGIMSGADPKCVCWSMQLRSSCITFDAPTAHLRGKALESNGVRKVYYIPSNMGGPYYTVGTPIHMTVDKPKYCDPISTVSSR